MTKEPLDDKSKIEYWQTYRRFNDFHDFHSIVKRHFPALQQQHSGVSLPAKSFRTNLNDEFLERRRFELNKYLQHLINPYVLANHPKLVPLLLKFLENRRWENPSAMAAAMAATAKPNTSLFKQKVDSLLVPMISSVNSFQASIKNAPDNVFGMVKGFSDNLITLASGDNSSNTSNNNNNGQTARSSPMSSMSASLSHSPSQAGNFSSPSTSSLSPPLPHLMSKSSQSDSAASDEVATSNQPKTASKSSGKDLKAIDRTILNSDEAVRNLTSKN